MAAIHVHRVQGLTYLSSQRESLWLSPEDCLEASSCTLTGTLYPASWRTFPSQTSSVTSYKNHKITHFHNNHHFLYLKDVFLQNRWIYFHLNEKVIFIQPSHRGDVIITSFRSPWGWWSGTLEGSSGSFLHCQYCPPLSHSTTPVHTHTQTHV